MYLGGFMYLEAEAPREEIGSWFKINIYAKP